MRFLGLVILVGAVVGLLVGRVGLAGAAVLFLLGGALIGFGGRDA